MTSSAGADTNETRRRAFLAAAGIDPHEIEALPGDASARRYYRLPARGLLLMEERPGAPDLASFALISRHLISLGLSAPRVDRLDLGAGYALIEDFGQKTFNRLLVAGEAEAPLYELAVEALVHLHERGASAARPDLPAYDFAPLTAELEMFTDWYVPECAPAVDAAAFKTDFLKLWHVALADISKVTDVLVLRDYHVDNLMVLDGREGAARCGLLDFQDALFGSPAYDLVSLTQDARRDLAPGLEDHLIDHYLALRPDLDRDRFLADYWLLAAHRHTKILGNFERLSKRDGKHGYLAFLPRVQAQLQRALPLAGLGAISAFMARELPGWATHIPTIPGAPAGSMKAQAR